jgi:hypothetical protein
VSRTAEYVLEESDRGWDVVVTGPWSEGAAQALVAGRADGLVLNYARGFVGHDLDFLAGGLPVRRLEVLHRGITDLSPIERIGSSLEALNVQPADDAELDLSPLERLTSLAAEWWLIAQTVSSVPLQSLITWSYGEPDLHACGHNLDLRRLVVKDAPRLESLSGVDSLSRLEHLGVLLAPNLSDLDALRSLSGSLRDLELEDCVATCVGIDTHSRW